MTPKLDLTPADLKAPPGSDPFDVDTYRQANWAIIDAQASARLTRQNGKVAEQMKFVLDRFLRLRPPDGEEEV